MRLVVFLTLFSLALGQQLNIPRDDCTWRGNTFGQISQCQSDEIAVGTCGSGADADCENGDEKQYDMLLCCSLLGYRYENCQQHFADYGEDLSCPEITSGGSDPNVFQSAVVEAICGSGRDDDCQGYSHMISCCDGSFGNSQILATSGDCYWVYGDYGIKVTCLQQDDAMTGRCGSGRDPDCYGNDAYHGAQCCRVLRI